MVKIEFDLSKMNEQLAEFTVIFGIKIKNNTLSKKQIKEINKILDGVKTK